MKRLLALALALPFVGVPLGCASKVDTKGQVTQGFYAGQFEMLWDVSRKEMVRNGFSPDPDACNKAGKVMVSRWNVQLASFSGKGYREQATITMHDVPDKAGWYTVEVNVLRSFNKELAEPLNPGKAQWDAGVRQPDREQHIAYAIETFFLGHDVSTRFRSDYGMQSAPPPVAPPPVTPPTPAK
jgi:hypothetical protein